MQKKAIAVAIGAALGAPSAYAQTVEVYGKVYPQITTTEGSGGSASADAQASFMQGQADGSSAIRKRAAIKANNSRVGFRGNEDLGAGMKAIYQIETQVNIDEGNAASSRGRGHWAWRDSFVGLEGGFGTLRFGRMDTPFKNYGDTLSFLGVSSGNFVSVGDMLRKPGWASSNQGRFHERRSNAVDYETPKMGGVTVAAQWSTDELEITTSNRFNINGTTGAMTANNQVITQEIPTALSLAVSFEQGPLYLALAHETHTNFFGGSNNMDSTSSNLVVGAGATSKDTALQATIRYRLGIHTFEADFVKLEYTESPGTNLGPRFKGAKSNAYQLVLENRWNPTWRTQFHYVKHGAGSCSFADGSVCRTSGLEGTQISAGFAHYLSKRTYVFGLISQLTNGASAIFNNSDVDVNPGEDIRQMAIGVAHSF